MGVLTIKQKAEEYRQLAYQCVLNEVNNECIMDCIDCPLNISHFLDDEKEAVLIKIAAMREYQQNQAKEQLRNQVIEKVEKQISYDRTGRIIGGYILIGFIIWLISSIKNCFAG